MAGEQFRADRGTAISSAFAQLRPIEQHVLWLTAIERLVAADAAARLGIDPAELGQIAFHARDRLRVRYAAALRAATPRGCRAVAERLPAFALGAAPKDLQSGIRLHLVQCLPCAETLADLNELAGALRRARPAEPAGLPAPPPSAVAEAVPVPAGPGRVQVLGAIVIALGLAGVAGAAHTTVAPAVDGYAVSDGFLAPTLPTEIPSFDRPTVVLASTVVADAPSTPGGGGATEVLGAVLTAPTTTPAPAIAAVAPEPAPVPVEPPPVTEPAPGVVTAVVEPVADLVGGVGGLLGGVLGGLLGG